MPPPPRHSTTPEEKHARLRQSLEALREDVTAKIESKEKSKSRAHFLIGKIVMEHPEFLARLSPDLEKHLAELGSARKAIDQYAETVAEIAYLESILPR
jgi:hypothetical protein